MYTGQVLFVS